MKYLLTVLVFAQITYAQEVKSPGVLVLTPLDFALDESLASEAKKYEITMTDEQVQQCIAIYQERDEREIVRKMHQAECEFARESDISTSFTFYTYGWLTFKLYGAFDDAIIYPIKGQVNRELQDFQNLASAYKINWIVNIKLVSFESLSDGLSGKVSFELWNQNVGEIVQSETIEIDSRNRGMEMSCDDGELGCLVTNGAIFTASKVLETMYSDKKYWQ